VREQSGEQERVREQTGEQERVQEQTGEQERAQEQTGEQVHERLPKARAALQIWIAGGTGTATAPKMDAAADADRSSRFTVRHAVWATYR